MSIPDPWEPSPPFLCCRSSQTPSPDVASVSTAPSICSALAQTPLAQARALRTPPADLAIFSTLSSALPFLFLNSDARSAAVLLGCPQPCRSLCLGKMPPMKKPSSSSLGRAAAGFWIPVKMWQELRQVASPHRNTRSRH